MRHERPWECPGCDNCFCMYATCHACCKGKTEEQIKQQANAKGGFDFE